MIATRGGVLLLGGRSEIGLAVTRLLVEEHQSRRSERRADRSGSRTGGKVASVPPIQPDAAGVERKRGPAVVLAAREPTNLDAEASLLAEAGAATVGRLAFDATDFNSHRSVVEQAAGILGPGFSAVVAFGILGDQARAETDASHVAEILNIDFLAQASLLTHLANVMKRSGGGQIVAFSSIAGARVRRANYVYGSAKAGLDGFVTGLTASLEGTDVRVLLVRPGFVIGKMTTGMDPAPLATTPEAVAQATLGALAAGRKTVWVPRALGPVAALTHLVPARLWDRLPR